jgi:uncharacterized membrane protein
MSEAPVQLIVAAFQDEDGAKNALKELKVAKKEHLIKIDNAAVIRKDQKGKVHIKETKDMGGGKGAVIGGVVGAAIGILTGGAGLVLAGGGALVGGLAAKLRDGGFKDERLKKVGEGLTPGSSAIVAVIEHKWVPELEKEMQEAGADVLTETISADIAAQLEAGGEVAYSALADESGLTTSRVAGNEEQVEMSSTSFTEGATEHVEAVASEAGIAASRTVETAEGMAVEAAAATEGAVAYMAGVATDEGVAAVGMMAEIEAEEEEQEALEAGADQEEDDAEKGDGQEA